MKKSTEIKQERSAKIAAQTAIVDVSTTENRSLNPEETTQFRALQAEITALETELRDALAYEENLRSMGDPGSSVVPPAGQQQAAVPVFSLHRAIRSQMVNGGVVLSGPELEMHQRASAAALASNLPVAGFVLETRAAQTVTGNSGANGGALVATDLQSPIDFLRPAPLLQSLGAVYQSGLVGNLRYPKNEGGIVATWEGETDLVDETANVYGYLDSIPRRLTVTVPISLQNLMQSSNDLEAATAKEINAAIENAIDLAGINGTGTGTVGGQPMGILNNPDVNIVATGTNGSVPSWDMIVDMETAVHVANASASKMAYLFNPKTRGKLKKTKHEAGDLNYLMDKSGEVNGTPSFASNHVPSTLTKGTGTNLSAALYGDMTQLLINQWGFMDLSVDEFSRKKEGLVEITANVFLDVILRQPKSFSIVKGLITA